MRLRKVKGADEAVAGSPYVIHDPEIKKGKWASEVFGNNHPIRLEIGMGKGRFITELSGLHPEINYIGMEKMSSVLFRALGKRESEERENLYYLCADAEELPDFFEEGEVDGIYLNFSDPWPKDRHWKRRLTSREFLARYSKILKKDGIIEFKTDNQDLFTFSLAEAEEAGWLILDSTRDLYKSPMAADNVQTEYEVRFSTLGNPICKMIIKQATQEE